MPVATDHIEIRWRRTDSIGQWNFMTIPPAQDAVTITGVERGVQYQIEARAVAQSGAASPWVAQTHIVSGLSLGPLAITSISATSLADGVHLAWTVSDVQRSDVEYIVQRTGDIAGSPDGAGWTQISRVRALVFKDGVTDGVVRWYRVQASTYGGVTTTFSSSVNSRGKVSAEADFSEPMIDNGNFEASALLPPSGWADNANALTSYETATQQSGVRSVKVAFNSSSTQVSLSGSFNRSAMWTDGTAFSSPNGIAATGVNALSATLIGSSQSFNGAVFNFGASNANNSISCSGQTVTLPGGQFKSLRLCAVCINGDQASQSFQVNYGDGTHDTFVQSMSDWTRGAIQIGERVILTMAHINLGTGGSQSIFVFLHEYAFAINPAKTVASIVLPSNSSVIVLAMSLINPFDVVTARRFKVRPGEIFQTSGFIKTLSSASAEIVHAFYDANGNYINDGTTHGAVTTSAAWALCKSIDIVPASAVYSQILLHANTPSTSTAWFDNLKIIKVYDPSTSEIAKKGSVPPAYNPGISWVASATQIAWTCNLTGYRTDGNLTQFAINQSQTVTGLTASTTYNHYPFMDEATLGFNMVTTGGTGSPAWAHSGTNLAWTAEQAREDHVPLSKVPIAVATTASGSSSGSDPGSGTCPREDMKIRHKEWGVITAGELADRWEELQEHWLAWHWGSDRSTWVRAVVAQRGGKHNLWARIDFDCGDSFVGTPGHNWKTMAGEIKRSCELTMETAIPWTKGGTFPAAIMLERGPAESVEIRIDSPEQMYDVGEDEPVLETHNGNVLPC